MVKLEEQLQQQPEREPEIVIKRPRQISRKIRETSTQLFNGDKQLRKDK